MRALVLGDISSKQIQKRQMTVAALLMLAGLFIYLGLIGAALREDSTVREEELSSYSVGAVEDIAFHIDSSGYDKNGNYYISGWCVKPGVVYEYYNYGNDAHRSGVYNNMHFGFSDGTRVFLLPTKLERREDVNSLLNDGIDYGFCGFRSILPKNRAGEIEKGDPVLVWENPDKSQELFDFCGQEQDQI